MTSSGATGATGATGLGATGATGPTGPPGQPGSCCGISFLGHPEQCWVAGKALQWLHSSCSESCALYLSSDCSKIILERGGCYIINFTINLCNTKKCNNKDICISVQTRGSGKKTERFSYHMPITTTNTLFTASAGGIFISTYGQNYPTELMLILQSPDMIKVHQSTISIIGI